ncbi:hypothetical protein GCM10020331_036520 [Ectobacillus funiculus]
MYQLIHKKGPTTKVWLLEQTKMKQTTLTRMMDELLGKGLIRECGFGESSGGRPPTLYDVDAGNHFYHWNRYYPYSNTCGVNRSSSSADREKNRLR